MLAADTNDAAALTAAQRGGRTVGCLLGHVCVCLFIVVFISQTQRAHHVAKWAHLLKCVSPGHLTHANVQ